MRFSINGEYGNTHRLLKRKRLCARAEHQLQDGGFTQWFPGYGDPE